MTSQLAFIRSRSTDSDFKYRITKIVRFKGGKILEKFQMLCKALKRNSALKQSNGAKHFALITNMMIYQSTTFAVLNGLNIKTFDFY